MNPLIYRKFIFLTSFSLLSFSTIAQESPKDINSAYSDMVANLGNWYEWAKDRDRPHIMNCIKIVSPIADTISNKSVPQGRMVSDNPKNTQLKTDEAQGLARKSLREYYNLNKGDPQEQKKYEIVLLQSIILTRRKLILKIKKSWGPQNNKLAKTLRFFNYCALAIMTA